MIRARVTEIWRHPIKSHGRERVAQTILRADEAMPWDRVWAVTHARSRFDPDAPGWVMCRNFVIGTTSPRLAGLWAQLDASDPERPRIGLRHRDLGGIDFAPDDPREAARFLDWVAPLTEGENLRPVGLARLPGRGFTDTDFPSVSIMNAASHRAVQQRIGRPLEPTRWRGNIWLEGLAPWEEFDLIGSALRIGEAVVEIVEPIARCKHTMANPETGRRDTDTLGALEEGWGHRDFGVYGRVIEGGRIAEGDEATPA